MNGVPSLKYLQFYKEQLLAVTQMQNISHMSHKISMNIVSERTKLQSATYPLLFVSIMREVVTLTISAEHSECISKPARLDFFIA